MAALNSLACVELPTTPLSALFHVALDSRCPNRGLMLRQQIQSLRYANAPDCQRGLGAFSPMLETGVFPGQTRISFDHRCLCKALVDPRYGTRRASGEASVPRPPPHAPQAPA